MKTYICTSKQGRERGAIGIFHAIRKEYKAVDMYQAEEMFRKDYELHHVFIREGEGLK